MKTFIIINFITFCIFSALYQPTGNLDDRPLYWARNKMQAWLKRCPAFKNDYDIETAIIFTGSALDKIIVLFEQLSRNYTGIDFSEAKVDADTMQEAANLVKEAEKRLEDAKKLPESTTEEITNKQQAIAEAQSLLDAANKDAEKMKKPVKVLITGFDPFTLNQFKYRGFDINTQNPSGISALYFHGKSSGRAYIQTAIFPVRYEDFDREVVEKLVENNISEFDIMMTMSRNDRTFDLERFACKFRGGFVDNMNIGDARMGIKPYYEQLKINPSDWDETMFKQISTSGNEFYETTLPISKILVDDLEPTANKVFFDQSCKDDKGFKKLHPRRGGQPNSVNPQFNITDIKGKSTYDSGSGSDYLSNEAMYRATKKREQMKFNLEKEIGHVHITEGMNFTEANNLIAKIIKNAAK